MPTPEQKKALLQAKINKITDLAALLKVKMYASQVLLDDRRIIDDIYFVDLEKYPEEPQAGAKEQPAVTATEVKEA